MITSVIIIMIFIMSLKAIDMIPSIDDVHSLIINSSIWLMAINHYVDQRSAKSRPRYPIDIYN